MSELCFSQLDLNLSHSSADYSDVEALANSVEVGSGAMVRAEALASLVSTARSYWIRRS